MIASARGAAGVRGRSALLLASCVFLLEARPVVAGEIRTTTSFSIVRPDRLGYTSFWDWGPGAGLGVEFIPHRSRFGIVVSAEFAELPGNGSQTHGDTLTVAPWRQTRIFAGLKRRFRPFREAPRLSFTVDFGLGRALLKFGEVRIQSSTHTEVHPRNQQWGGVFTYGGGLEFVGDRWGVFVDVRSEMYSESMVYTWNAKRFGVIWRAIPGRERG